MKKEQLLSQTKRELETMDEYKVCFFSYQNFYLKKIKF
jgi:hypothetical protein